MPIIPRSEKPKEKPKQQPKVIKTEKVIVVEENIEDSEDPFLRRRMMESPPESEKNEVYELRETVYDNKSKKSRDSEKERKIKSENVIKKEQNNVFKMANDRMEMGGKSHHVLEFGKLQKLKSERDIDDEKRKFISLKQDMTEHDKSYKVIQNKNSKKIKFGENNLQLDFRFYRESRSKRKWISPHRMCL